MSAPEPRLTPFAARVLVACLVGSLLFWAMLVAILVRAFR